MLCSFLYKAKGQRADQIGIMSGQRFLYGIPWMGVPWKRRLLALLLAPLILGFTNDVTPVSAPISSEDKQGAAATAHVVKSILEYTRWPEPRNPVRLCVVGSTRFGAAFPYATLGTGARITQINVSQPSDLAARCDALYLGDIGPERARKWNAAVRGTPVVTIAEQDPECASEAMFCLIYGPRSISFQLNLDAIARSKVKIDPRVFRIARGS